MTETAETIIFDALQLLGIQGDEEPIEAPMAQTAIRVLNRMMDSFAAEGINLGYTTVTDLSTPITVPLGAVRGMISNLAVELAPTYITSGIPASVAALAANGKFVMQQLAVDIGATEYPNTLPRGSGNDLPDYTKQHFYPDLEDDILAESPGSIGTESGTYEDVNG